MFPCKTVEICMVSNGNCNASPEYPPLVSAGVMFCALFRSHWKVVVRSQHEYGESEQKNFSNLSKLLFQLIYRRKKLKSFNNNWQVNELNIDQQSTPC